MYRQLSKAEIETLKKQGCVAEKWEKVEVGISFSAEGISNVRFAGNVKLGTQRGNVQIDEGISKPATIRNCFIENCTIGENVFLSNVGSLINYQIGNQVIIENVGSVIVSGKSAFGNGHKIDVLNEGGGRELPIFDKLSAQIAYFLVIYRHNNALIEKLNSLVEKYIETKRSTFGLIGENSIIQHTKSIKNVNIGAFAKIVGASKLVEGTVDSKKVAPVYIGEEVVAEDFIVLSGSKIDGNSILTSTFVGQGVKIGRQFSAENSTFFANSEAFHGEACSVFAGPYTVTHHKSTLLIAGMFLFYNAGSGSNQSNHMYKLGPIHQGIVERGSKTGSLSYMLWPCRVGAFSVVMNKHSGNFDTTDLPFSYISVSNGKSIITPAMNLFTVGTARDSKKWPSRDRRKDPNKLDLINFELFNPYTVQKIIRGSELLEKLHQSTPKTREYANHKGVHINRLMLRTSKRYYDLAITVYLYSVVIEKLKEIIQGSIKEIREQLTPHTESEQNQWIDILGMIADKGTVEGLIHSVCENEINSIDQLQISLKEIFNSYSDKTYSWVARTIKERENIDVSNIAMHELEIIINEWRNSSVKLKKMILKDAEKEFDQLSRIGFGIDGDSTERDSDFEAIRGVYEENSFVAGLKNEIDEIESTAQKLLNQIQEKTERQ